VTLSVVSFAISRIFGEKQKYKERQALIDQQSRLQKDGTSDPEVPDNKVDQGLV
jgi:hypothetical protein